MIRILKSNGRALIYVWAKNQEINSKKSTYLRQGEKGIQNGNTENRKSQQAKIEVEKLQEESNTLIQLPIHVNRTKFEKQDVFVPWKLKNNPNNNSNINKTTNNNETFLRYYHVFEENELENLCKTIGNIEVKNSYYDEGNWCIIIRKL